MDVHNNVLDFIKLIRESHSVIPEIYKSGSCYNFYLILKYVFPQSKPYFDENHIITEINGKFYDITGEVTKSNKHIEFESYYYGNNQQIIEQQLYSANAKLN